MKMETCEHCDKKNICKTLCDKMEKYVNQDYIKSTGLTFTELNINPEMLSTENEKISDYEFELTTADWIVFVKKYDPSPKQKKYIYLKYWKGLTLEEIGKLCNTSKQAVDKMIKRFIRTRVDKSVK